MLTFAEESSTHFLNVDLDIYSKRNLQPLVDCFGTKVTVNYVGRERGQFSAHLEIAKIPTTADSTIRAFCRLINTLPLSNLRMWNAAIVRRFSIGVEAVVDSPVREFQIRQSTLTAVSAIGAEIVLAVYAPARQHPRISGGK